MSEAIEKQDSSFDSIELRSDDVQDILSHMPNWMIRWGITVIFLILLIVFSISWVIKYPDVISGPVTLTTHKAPVRLVSKTSGELKSILVNEDQWVEAGTPIAEITSDLEQNEVEILREVVQDVQNILNHTSEKLPSFPQDLSLGDLQRDYHHLNELLDKYFKASNDLIFNNQLHHLKQTLMHTKRLRNFTAKQAELTHLELEKLSTKYEGNKELHASGAMTKFDLLSFEAQYIQKQKEYQANEKQVVQTDLNIEQLKHDLFQKELEHDQQMTSLKFDINQAIQSINNNIQSWERSHLISAPISGQLSYLSTIGQGDYISGGTPLFALVPNDDSLVAHIYVSNSGIGKVEINQLVRLKFANYPHHEYGLIWGRVNHIASIPNQNQYRIDVSLTDGLKTNFNIDLEFTPEMSGQAEIVVEDVRLFDRIFNNLRKLLNS